MRRPLISALSLLALAMLLSGCNWKGDGKTVAAALLATKDVKTRAFVGSLKFDSSKMKSLGGSAAGAGDTTMTFSGAIDTSDPAHEKMRMEMTASGETTTMVAPGDGRLYVTAGGRSWYGEAEPGAEAQQTIDPQRIYAALGDAVGKFEKSPPITNAKGVAVTTYTAKLKKSKLCGEVLEAFGDALDHAGGLEGGFGGTSSKAENEAGSKLMQSFCKTLLKGDPRVWFGVDGGRLTDVELTARLQVPMAGEMGIEVQYHEFDQDKPQSGFDAPAGAQPLSSAGAAQMGGLGGATAATTF